MTADGRQPSVVVVGSLNMDLVSAVPRFPQPGETLQATSFAQVPGGKGANQALCAGRLGGACGMVGRVGADGFGQSLRQTLADQGVDVRHVKTTPATPSGIATIWVDGQAENMIAVVPGANAQLSADDVREARAMIAAARVLLVQLEIPLGVVAVALELARDCGCLTILDPAPAGNSLSPPLWEVDLICPNAHEASALLGVPVISVADAQRAAQMLAGRGPSAVAITLGAEGVVFRDASGKLVHLPPFPSKAVDSTAAGDAFAGAVAVALAEGREMAEAIRWGAAAGAIAASRHGAQPAMPTRQELHALLAS